MLHCFVSVVCILQAILDLMRSQTVKPLLPVDIHFIIEHEPHPRPPPNKEVRHEMYF